MVSCLQTVAGERIELANLPSQNPTAIFSYFVSCNEIARHMMSWLRSRRGSGGQSPEPRACSQPPSLAQRAGNRCAVPAGYERRVNSRSAKQKYAKILAFQRSLFPLCHFQNQGFSLFLESYFPLFPIQPRNIFMPQSK